MSIDFTNLKRENIFPGKGWREIIRNEYLDITKKGEYRREFFVMVFYSIILVIFTFITLYVEDIARDEWGEIFTLFVIMGAYYGIDDLFRRKKLISQPLLFLIDSIFYNGVILAIVIMTGGYDSPVRFFLFFLTAISSPIYGTGLQALFFMLSVSFLQVILNFTYHGPTHHLFISLFDGFALVATASLIKISISSYEKKAKDYKLLSFEQERLYVEAAEYNMRLEEVVATKTNDLQKLLADAENDRVNSDKQRIATMNILEDMTETQAELKKSKESLEVRQAELEAIAELSGKLNSVTSIESAIDVTNVYLSKFVDFNSTTFVLLDVDGKGNFAIRSLLNKPVSRKLLDVSVKEATNLLLNYKAVDEPMAERIRSSKIFITGERPSGEDNPDKYATFTLPFKVGDKVFGAMHIASHKQEFYQDFFKEQGKRAIISAIISTASAALSGLEQVLKAQQSKTESLIQSLSNGIIMMDKNMDVVLSNPSAEKFARIDKSGKGLDAFFDNIKEFDLRTMIANAADKGEESKIKEIELDHKYYEIYVNAVKDFQSNVMGVALIIHDITQLKIIDQMKSEFVSVASHQLRTPLTAIRLFIEMLIRGDVGELSAPQKEYLSHVFESTDRMVRLVNDLLNVTRIESNRMQIAPEPTQLEELIGSVVDEAKPLAELRKITLSFSKPKKKTPLVPVDKSLFRQVIHNLVTNAIKYTEPKGKSSVTLELKGDDYLVTVDDDGIGIPEKFKNKIFQKFSRADNAVKTETEGTGLGLYVSQKIVESFDGRIWFETKKDKGTRFFVLMPSAGMKAKKGERGLAIS